ncbi:MAG: hypothetical protein AVDCRST_MAG56-1190 [uncultured Cytophagales bacterium]|uniref:Uncharacterized protein n=1 Tax=uncultured Cytophagales bacterium TaxID=158755 RepID=A0A6J4HZ01_9SPHI|nr:MAG: hypothetical protein AVDCRST_MAG56-1190 [uncultured Cytophagales bacterium]
MMLPPADQPAPRHWAGPTRRDTTGAETTIRPRNQRCLTAWLLTAYPQGKALITYKSEDIYLMVNWLYPVKCAVSDSSGCKPPRPGKKHRGTARTGAPDAGNGPGTPTPRRPGFPPQCGPRRSQPSFCGHVQAHLRAKQSPSGLNAMHVREPGPTGIRQPVHFDKATPGSAFCTGGFGTRWWQTPLVVS